MDPDLPVPSIEQDDNVSARSLSAKNTTASLPIMPERMSLDGATNTPLPPSSPLKSPHRTPRPETYSFAQTRHVSPSLNSSRSSTVMSTQPASPTLSNKRSMSGLNGGRGSPVAHKPTFRRASSNLNPSSPSMTLKAFPPAATENKSSPLTAESVAKEFFGRELRHHETLPDPETVVIVHDSCYGHRFSRPRTSKAGLSTIVERPERIRATILGLSAAYVRLGERHADGRCGPHPGRDVASCTPPPFKIRKTSRSIPLNHPSTTHVHGSRWMEELQIMCDSAEAKLAMNGKELVRPIGYGKDENGNPLPRLHEGDLYLCSESLNALQGCLGGVCDAVDAVMTSPSTRRAFVCIRPPGHHCSSNYPSGFCWLNNVHVGISYAAMNHGLTHAAIIDFDLHHGDGSQSITWDHNRRAKGLPRNAAPHKKTPIGYYSLHDINSYPCEFGDEEKVRNASLCIENAHGQSIWNVHLEPWKSSEQFWELYEKRYSIILEKARSFLHYHTGRLKAASVSLAPKAAIFLSAGFDASEWEGEGMQRHKVNVPTDFYARFTRDVVKLSEEEGLGVDGRVISVLEGGYSDRALTSGAFSHVCGLSTGRLEDEMAGKSSYDVDWWTREQLELLESRVFAGEPAPVVKKKEKGPSNYSSPTQASTAKITDFAKERRSISAEFESRMNLDSEFRTPPPEVDWATAAYELSRLIIPHDRQTLSCRYDELNTDTSRNKKERQSLIGVADLTDERMQLRDRKAKPAQLEARPVRPSSRDRRRTTIAAVADLPDPNFGVTNGEQTAAATRPRRRSSGASSIVSGLQSMQLDGDSSKQSDVASQRTSHSPPPATTKATKPAVVKKPRTTTAAKAANKPRSSPKKAENGAPPVPRVPSAFTKQPLATKSTEEITTDQRSSSQTRSGSASSVVRADDLDSLSAGVKKMSIKLRVKSPEEAVSRGETNAPDMPKKAKTARKPTAPKVPKPPRAGPSKSSVADSTNADITSAQSSVSIPDNQLSTHTTLSASTSVSHQPDIPALEAVGAASPLAQIPNTVSSADGADMSALWHGSSRSEIPQTEKGPDESTHILSSSGSSVPTTSQVLGFPAANPSADVSGPEGGVIVTPTQDIHGVESPSTTPEAILSSHSPPRSTSPSPPPPTHFTTANDEPKTVVVSAPPTATVKRTKADLPVFTSSSPIPFAKTHQGTGFLGSPNEQDHDGEGGDDDQTDMKESESIWDIPVTPHR